MALKPCPFCNGVHTQIEEQTYWTGMRNNITGYTLRHWCEKSEDSYINGSITFRTRTKEQAEKIWNERSRNEG